MMVFRPGDPIALRAGPESAQLVALGSLALVAAYPFMKRITWWPQAWLGLVFTWGALVGWIAIRTDQLEVLAALYAGSILWCIGYDTIYALQDREDDALVGIRSSALRLGGVSTTTRSNRSSACNAWRVSAAMYSCVPLIAPAMLR